MTPTPPQHYRVGLLGTGYIADWHLKALRQLRGVQVVAVADIDLRRAQAVAASHGVAGARASLEEMLAADKLDAVHVLTPPQTHYAAAQAALASNVHVLLEKPMCLDHQHCADLVTQARSRGLQLGVNHNYLFSTEYEKLRRDVTSGLLGRIDYVTITWNKPLGQLASGPFDIWMLRQPQNIILEIGPHSVAHLLDLVGPADHWRIHVDNPLQLPNGTNFFRRWRIGTERGRVAADLVFSFNAGSSEHSIHVRGSHGTATVDFENQTYTLDRSTRYGLDFDRFWRVRRCGGSLRRQARRNLSHYLLSKLKLSDRGNSFGLSIQHSLRAFYASLAGQSDPRIAGEMGASVVQFCQQLAEAVQQGRSGNHSDQSPIADSAAGLARPATNGVAIHRTDSNGAARPRGRVLVLGGTGFIGKELVRQLSDQHYAVRVLTRGPVSPTDANGFAGVEFVQGSMADSNSLAAAMAGVDQVFHLARAHVKRWEDYYQQDVLGAQRVAEACLKAGVKRLLYTGTIDSYYAGHGAGTIREETGLDPKIRQRNNYARAKCEAENLLMRMHREQRLPVVIFRPGIVVGPGGNPFHWGVGMWSANTVCQLWGDGDNPLPIVLVEDVAAALVKAMEVPNLEGQSFNLVGDPCLTARQYVAELERHLDVKLDVLQTAIWKFYAIDLAKWCVKCIVRHPDRKMPSYRDWESRSQRALFDCSKAKQALGWQPTVDRDRIIERAIAAPAAELLL